MGALPYPVSLLRQKPEVFERLNILSFVGAMKIARNTPVSGRHDEWHPPFVGAMKIARKAPISGRHDEWHPPFVGAMKIARNVPVSERSDEWYAPIPGSLSEGAVTPEWA